MYNTFSNIDEHGISELSLAAHLSNAIQTNSNIDKDNLLTQLAPKFIWIIRDFTLEKIHPETGQEISSKEYLELCLKRKISGKNSSDNNLIRDNIIKYFPDRDCVTLVRPVDQENDLHKLNDIPFEKLKPTFKWEFKQLRDKIYKETTPKRIYGKKLTGTALSNLIIEFVNTINSGNIPNINNSWDSVINKDIKDYYDKALLKYKSNIKKMNEKVMEQEDLLEYIYDYKLEACILYSKLLHLNEDTFSNEKYMILYIENKNKLEKEMTATEEVVVKTNFEKSKTLCNDTIKSEFKMIDKKLFDKYYTTKLIPELCQDYKEFLQSYSEKSKGLNKLQILINFLNENEKVLVNYLIKKLA